MFLKFFSMMRYWLVFIAGGLAFRHEGEKVFSNENLLPDEASAQFLSAPPDTLQIACDAVMQGNLSVLQMMHAKHIPLNMTCNMGRNLVVMAVVNQQVEVLKYLVQLHISMNTPDKWNDTAAFLAIDWDCTPCLETLLAAGADPNERKFETCHEEMEANAQCQQRWTLAHFAASWETGSNALKILHDHGASLDLPAWHGLTPAHVAVVFWKDVKENQTARLTRLGALGVRLDSPDDEGRTPAHFACKFLNEASTGENVTHVLEILHSYGARLDAVDNAGRTPAHYCAMGFGKNHEANAKALDFVHAIVPLSVQAADKNGSTPEELAVEKDTIAQVFFAKLKVQQTAQTCTALERDVGDLFDCREDAIIMPPGFVAHGPPLCKPLCAARCPNSLACPGFRVLHQNRSCEVGYSLEAMGCSQCEAGFGRSNQDPFVCKSCGAKRWLLWVGHAATPAAIYLVSIQSAQKRERDRQSAIIKIILSFGQVAASLWPAVKESEVYGVTSSFMQSLVSAGDVAASSTTPWHGPSIDCLLDAQNAPMTSWLLVTLAMPTMLLAVSVVAAAVQSGANASALSTNLVRPWLVLSNCFLPDILGGFIRFVPCMHFQTDGRSFVTYEIWRICDEKYLMGRALSLAGTLVFGTLCGPFLWLWLLKRAQAWPAGELQERLGYLLAGYRTNVSYWEVCVLVRKCALVIAASLFPVSYSPILLLASVLMITSTSLACHAYVQPYEDGFLNFLELNTLSSSALATLCTIVIKLQPVEWTLDLRLCEVALVILSVALLEPLCLLLLVFFRDGSFRKPQPEKEPGGAAADTQGSLTVPGSDVCR